MFGLIGWIVGTAFLWFVILVIIDPITRRFAQKRLEKKIGFENNKINFESIPSRYFMFFGSVVFMVLGFFIGYLLGLFFIGISLRGRDIPGIISLILSSFAGNDLFLNGFGSRLGLTLITISIMITCVTGVSTAIHSPRELKCINEVRYDKPSFYTDDVENQFQVYKNNSSIISNDVKQYSKSDVFK